MSHTRDKFYKKDMHTFRKKMFTFVRNYVKTHIFVC